MSEPNDVVCWEIVHAGDPLVRQVSRLYEETQAPAERIPWEWIERSVGRRKAWRPGRWCPHLLVTTQRTAAEEGPVSGFAYGGHVPGFGGYLSYLGVDPNTRKQGVGVRLFEQFFRTVALDAAAEGTQLPFVVWESHRPDAHASPADRHLWTARLRLFARVGGRWVEGITFQSPHFGEGEGPPVPLQLFVKPIDLPAESFDAERLKALAEGLHRNIYRHGSNDPLLRQTLPPGCNPQLQSPLAADAPTGTV